MSTGAPDRYRLQFRTPPQFPAAQTKADCGRREPPAWLPRRLNGSALPASNWRGVRWAPGQKSPRSDTPPSTMPAPACSPRASTPHARSSWCWADPCRPPPTKRKPHPHTTQEGHGQQQEWSPLSLSPAVSSIVRPGARGTCSVRMFHGRVSAGDRDQLRRRAPARVGAVPGLAVPTCPGERVLGEAGGRGSALPGEAGGVLLLEGPY